MLQRVCTKVAIKDVMNLRTPSWRNIDQQQDPLTRCRYWLTYVIIIFLYLGMLLLFFCVFSWYLLRKYGDVTDRVRTS